MNFIHDSAGNFSWKRTITTVLASLAIIIGILLFAFTLRGGTIIKTSVNTMGEPFVGVPVSVEDVSFFPLTGNISLHNLVISNPEGFKSDYLFKMGDLNVKVDMIELLKGKVHIKQVVVESPHVIYDKKLTTSNVNELQKILEEKYPLQNDSGSQQDGPTVIIDDLIVREGRVSVNIVGSIPVPLAEIHLTDVGKDGAMLPGQIIGFVFKQLFYSIFSAVDGVVGGVTDGVVGGVKAIGSGIGSLFSSSETNETANAESDSAK